MEDMQDDLNGKLPRLKMTSMKYNLKEDSLHEIQPQWKITSMKRTSMEDDLN